jgi:GT2 family glycosyltransferase
MTTFLPANGFLLQKAPGAPSSPRQSIPDRRKIAGVEVDGKFLKVNGERFWVRAVTYGTFKANSVGEPFPEFEQVQRDFAAMKESGINTVRLYNVPSDRIADAAHAAGLMLIPDMCWGARTCELDYPQYRQMFYDYLREHTRRLAKHPAILMFSIGNEIPPLMVRWHGRELVEAHLKKLYDISKEEAPNIPVTYANHPPAEHLNLGFLDVVSFNVYLEREKELRAYLARLQSIAGDRPLMISELGLDGHAHGHGEQARYLAMALRCCFEKGLCGAAVYAWTDEWSIFEEKIEGWSFGITDVARRPKPALEAVRHIYSSSLYDMRGKDETQWPRVSVVVCSYNGGKTLARCLRSLLRMNYPNYEVIVVDDGSKDLTKQICRRYPIRAIHVPNGGLSRARNLGIEAAAGEIVAFIDSDAYADPDWLFYMVTAINEHSAGGVGGPNLSPTTDTFIQQCINYAPGNPTHVLLDDESAEHVPGCNMAFRKSALARIGNFDPTHRAAGDDVDVCWKLIIAGEKIAFAPSAIVWHHRRPTVKAFLRQQKGYGYAEAHLQNRYPSRFNVWGDLVWRGSVYDSPHIALRREGLPSVFKPKVYHGQYCSAQFQGVYQQFRTWWFQAFTTAEWFMLAMCTAASAAIAGSMQYLWTAIGIGIAALLMMSISVGSAMVAGMHAARVGKWKRCQKTRAFWIVTILHLLQPLARAWGRIQGHPHAAREEKPYPASARLYGNLWQRHQWLEGMQVHGKMAGWVIRPGTDWEEFDLQVMGPGPCTLQITTVYEDDVAHLCHYMRYRITAKRKKRALAIAAALLAGAATACVFFPFVAPLTLPILAYVWMVLRARKSMVRAMSQLTMEVGRPLGMTKSQDDF